MKTILTFLISTILLLSTWFLYDLTERDYSVLDAVEDRLFDLMEDNSWEAEYVIWAIQEFMSVRTLNEKSNALLLQLVDDIDYYWSTGSDGDIMWFMEAEDCYDDEYFDEDEQRCFPNQEKDLELDYEHMWSESWEDLVILAAYLLWDNDTLNLVDGNEDPKHQEIWELFSDMIPAAAREDLVSINFANNPNSDTAAFVEQTNEHHEKWKVIFNIDSYYIDGKLDYDESVHTNIHEFSHILTLNKTQIQLMNLFAEESEIERYKNTCSTYFLPEWCLLRTSYFKGFIDAFWDADELKTAWDQQSSDTYSPEEYVSDYAATNPGEDIAESFTTFVLKSKPTWNSEAEQKISYFYDFPELVKLRSFMRSRIKN